MQTSIAASLTITYTGVTGCTSSLSTPTFDVGEATQPVIEATPAVTEICSDGSETVTLAVTQIFVSYQWSPSSNTGSSISVTEPGIYSVETTNDAGCIGNAQIELTEKSGCSDGEIDVEIPKAFTPNGDGANDYWKISGIENMNQNCEVNIFDGRGRRVVAIKVSAFPVTGWDGTSGGTAVPAGTYYYVLGCPSGKPVTGSVLIVR